MSQLLHFYLFFFFNDTATTEIYTLSLHDALPIWVHDIHAIAAQTCKKAMEIHGLCVAAPRAAGRRGAVAVVRPTAWAGPRCRSGSRRRRRTCRDSWR